MSDVARKSAIRRFSTFGRCRPGLWLFRHLEFSLFPLPKGPRPFIPFVCYTPYVSGRKKSGKETPEISQVPLPAGLFGRTSTARRSSARLRRTWISPLTRACFASLQTAVAEESQPESVCLIANSFWSRSNAVRKSGELSCCLQAIPFRQKTFCA